MATAVEAFKMGLLKDSLFYDDLVMTPCRNLDEVRTRALRFIRLEDDKRIQERQVGSSKQENKDPLSKATNSNPITELTTRMCMLLTKKRMMKIILRFLNTVFPLITMN
uniref:Uncharacterized protein n=1 Tax=Helianthus annuus TaxID=4232 RepID=A0A251USD1_HELAN